MRKWLVGLGTLALALPASATISEALSLEQLVGSADHVVVGTVLSTHSQYDERGRIVTDVELQVEEAMKGPSTSGQSLVVRRLGGYVGDIGMTIEGEPTFEVGGRYLVFLRALDGGRMLRPVGMSQGVMAVQSQGGLPHVQPGGEGMALVQRVQGGALVPAPAALIHPEPLDSVRARIAAIVQRPGTVAP